MRLLAIETATAVTAIATLDGDAVDEVLVDDARRHTEVLAPAIAGRLERLGWRASDLDGVVVDVGPGLFTGLRVGVATAQGIALATGAPIHPVTSTDALAAAACDAGLTGEVVAVVDARRREVFVATYNCNAAGFEVLDQVTLMTPVDLAARLAGAPSRRVLVGDGAVRHADVLGPGTGRIAEELVVPSPGSAARLAATRCARGAVGLAPAEVVPWYLREADAVANFAVRDATT